jgi:prevent-host-death family protein
MEVSMAEAKARFAELVRLAEDGDEVILTRHGHPTAKIVPVNARPQRDWDEIRRRVKEIQRQVKAKEQPDWPDAAHSQDFLYDEHGLPA